MLRSFDYVATTVEFERDLGDRCKRWREETRRYFLDRYWASMDADLLPPTGEREALLGLYELEKALYELSYELEHRPHWARIPLRALASLAASRR